MTLASLRALSGHGDPGKFGRMFPTLQPLQASDDKLFALAEAMKDPDPAAPAGDNPTIPAGFTYLGQFVDHDLTLDLTPLDVQAADPLATTNFRSPALDLDSLYGQGPQLSPFMFARDPFTNRMSAKFVIGQAAESDAGPFGTIPAMPNDLPRAANGRAIIGDERNDENLLVAQTHLAVMKFHNAVVDRLSTGAGAPTGLALFNEARRVTTWHYQWMVLHDFVERLVGEGEIDRIRHEGRRFYRFRSRPYMPVEFAAAAYRLGHSMVRQSYEHNRVFNTTGGGIAPGTLDFLFHFTSKSGGIIGDLAAAETAPPFDPMKHFPSNWVIDWRRYVDLGAPLPAGVGFNASRRIDPFVVPALHTLPGELGRDGVLPFRNLKRGVLLELPSGQDVARAMGLQPLTGDELATDVGGGSDGTVLKAERLHTATPLWYYILKEAQLVHGGTRLGPVGATIIAECFLGFVHGDHDSYLWRQANWRPDMAPSGPGDFTMADMIKVVNDANPVG
jgi:hypothetical protein